MSGVESVAKDLSSGKAQGGIRRFTRKQLVVAGILAAAVAVWLVLFLTVGGDFYQTVEEVKATGPQQNTRVGGTVSAEPGGIAQEGAATRFVLEGEAGETLKVVYRGPALEGLGALQEVVAAGTLTPAGDFEATEVLIKCPDKLFPEKVTNRLLGAAGLERVLY